MAATWQPGMQFVPQGGMMNGQSQMGQMVPMMAMPQMAMPVGQDGQPSGQHQPMAMQMMAMPQMQVPQGDSQQMQVAHQNVQQNGQPQMMMAMPQMQMPQGDGQQQQMQMVYMMMGPNGQPQMMQAAQPQMMMMQGGGQGQVQPVVWAQPGQTMMPGQTGMMPMTGMGQTKGMNQMKGVSQDGASGIGETKESKRSKLKNAKAGVDGVKLDPRSCGTDSNPIEPLPIASKDAASNGKDAAALETERRRELLQRHAGEVVQRLRRSAARRSTDSTATQLRHSTFSALNLEVCGGSRRSKALQPLSRESLVDFQREIAASQKRRALESKIKLASDVASTSTTESENATDEADMVSIVSEDKVFVETAGSLSRHYLLCGRRAFDGVPPPELQSLSAQTVAMFGAHSNKLPMSRDMQLQRDVNCYLNKVCPENLAAITQRIAATEVHSAEELQMVISLIFKKALAEPHYCETYADLVSNLKQSMPEFTSPTGRSVTFKTALLNTTQSEFEALSNILTLTSEDTKGLCNEGIELLKKKRKDRVLANMKFIGQLFLRSLLSARIVGSVLRDLSKCDKGPDAVPQEPMVECLCELIQNIGFTLEAYGQDGKDSLESVCSHLQELKRNYGKRIQFAIQDVLDVRCNGWRRRTFKASAKTKGEIYQEHLRAQAWGCETPAAEVQIAGARRFAA